MEGGGPGAGGKAAIRRGMDRFLRSAKDAARTAGIRWNLVLCGPRSETYKRFREDLNQTQESVANILLVDAETRVTTNVRVHLESQEPPWDLSGADDEAIHLMVQIMETWLVADPETLVGYYGKDFNVGSLPKRHDLEQEPKKQVEDALRNATKPTQKGTYHKIKHASELLGRIDPARVQARCRHCKRFFEDLDRVIRAAR